MVGMQILIYRSGLLVFLGDISMPSAFVLGRKVNIGNSPQSSPLTPCKTALTKRTKLLP